MTLYRVFHDPDEPDLYFDELTLEDAPVDARSPDDAVDKLRDGRTGRFLVIPVYYLHLKER